jgi:hypothetical protein
VSGEGRGEPLQPALNPGDGGENCPCPVARIQTAEIDKFKQIVSGDFSGPNFRHSRCFGGQA